MPAIEYGTTIIKYKVVRSDRKTVGLEVSIEGGVKIRAPEELSENEIEEVVEKKAEWILKKQDKLSDVKPAPIPKEFLSGEKLPYLGRRYRIKVKESDNVDQVKVKLYQGKFWIMVSKDVSDSDSRRELIRDEVIQWYRSHADQKIRERVKKYQEQIGEAPNLIKVKKQKKRWGSCSSKRNLNFNWKLIMAPMSVVDYLVVHELAHLKYPNHSKEFWQLVEAVIPNYEEKQEWLRVNGRQLSI
ncbi:M48 family metallopeptidase [Halanaerobacter jeridensis]|uniref:Metal-dependent hydrolase n=1 Tax=Halanaerobacter jeridensis TaxID=706427 RepID=A0A939BPH0_9FIRM|nr:SprT family zinc-dependent metalloprotease [Halanaerobacter jeridensis]MBM7556838.1 putative metal-dependent hydrolase [Halanaerobacter jeridensis]